MKPIRDRTGNVIGHITETETRREIRNRSAGLLAWYDKHQDKTFKRDGNLFGYGDQTFALLPPAR